MVAEKFQILQFSKSTISHIYLRPKIYIRKLSTAAGGCFLQRFLFFETKWGYVEKFPSLLKVRNANEFFSDNAGQSIFAIYCASV